MVSATTILRTLAQPDIPGGRWVQTGYVLADLFLIFLNALAVYYFRYAPDWLPALLSGAPARLPTDPLGAYLSFYLPYAGLLVLSFQAQALYSTQRTRTSLDESLAVFKAVLLATLLLTSFIYLSGVKTISRLVIVWSGLLNAVTLSAWRAWKREVVEQRARSGNGARNVIIVGAGRMGHELARHIEQNRQFGLVVKGFLDGNHAADPRVLGKIEDLASVTRSQFIDEVLLTIPSARDVVRSVAQEARRLRLDVKVIPELYDGLAWRAPIEYLGDFPVMSLHREPIPALGQLVKRSLDFVGASLGLLFLSPLLCLIALAIKLDSPGPVFYRSRRVGRKAREFVCYKFRTMVADAEARKDGLRHLNERRGPFFKISNDPRLTSLGKLLRKYSLDELLQLWNVLKGEMSLVGPRPHPVDDYRQYTLDCLRRLDVTPGLTGLWQVSARRDPSFERNLALDLEYIETWNLWLDLKILLRTAGVVAKGEGQ